MLSATRFVVVALLCLGHFCTASADDFSLRQDEPTTGSSLRRKVVLGNLLPISKTYSELTDAEKEIVRDRYNNMPKTDEPPYPRYGLVSIYKAISTAHKNLLVDGKVEMYVTVNGDGKPLKVSIYQSPDSDVSRVFSTVLLLTEFKPAVCSGQPCTMEFPLVLTLKIEH